MNFRPLQSVWKGRPGRRAVGAVALSVGMLAGMAAGQSGAAGKRLNAQQINLRVNALLQKMTLQEKVGQMSQYFALPIPRTNVHPAAMAAKGEAGSFLFVTSPVEINKLEHIAMEQSPDHIPILFGYDVIHGFHTVFPVPIAMAASWDPGLYRQVQTVASDEASAVGIRWSFSPMVDIARDARWGRMVEGAGEDAFLGAAMARAQVEGLQGPYLGSPHHVAATMKHFAAYGAADGGRDYDSVYVPRERLFNVYLKPFHAAVEAGVASTMSAYMDLNDVPATGNKFLLQDVLRKDWGFKGFVVTDAFAVKNLTTHGFTKDDADAAYRAVEAGVDMDMGSGVFAAQLPGLVKSGRVSMATINNAVRHILTAKYQLGLFQNPYVDVNKVQQVFNDPAHKRLALEAAEQTMVLLKNANGLLPLDAAKIHSVAVIGRLANDVKDMEGSWVVINTKPEGPSVLEALRSDLPGAQFTYAPGPAFKRKYPSMFDRIFGGPKAAPETAAQKQQMIDAAVTAAKESDVTVMVLGELADMSGEAASRATLTLPGLQQEMLEKVEATGKPMILVLMSGRPLNITWAAKHVPAILQSWYPGEQGGVAIANVLLGKASPSGKLPVTWPRSVGQEPIYYAHNLTHQPDNAPGFTSRYWDESSFPLYPFGYGLSYTTFAFSNLRVSRPTVKVGQPEQVSVEVKNTGTRIGADVVQLYIHQRWGSSDRPMRELKGFQKVTLKPGESKTLRFTLGREQLKYWSEAKRGWVNEASTFDVWAGDSSAATLHSSFAAVQ